MLSSSKDKVCLGLRLARNWSRTRLKNRLNFSAPFGLIRGRMDYNDTKRSRNPSQLRGSVDFCIIGIVTDGDTAGTRHA